MRLIFELCTESGEQGTGESNFPGFMFGLIEGEGLEQECQCLSVIRIEIKEGFVYESVCKVQVVVLPAKEGFSL